MIYSMTAFARAQTELHGFMVSWELRSVNHRYLEAQFRMPEGLRSLPLTIGGGLILVFSLAHLVRLALGRDARSDTIQ